VKRGRKWEKVVVVTVAAAVALSTLCTAQAKEHTVTICIDPGHGGTQSGAVAVYDGVEVQEKDINLTLARLLKEALEGGYRGVKVSLTRAEDETVDLDARSRTAQEVGADVLISLHNNAKGEQFDYDHGCTVLVSKGQYRPEIAEEEQKLGCNLLYELEQCGLENQGLLLRTSEKQETYPNGELADYYRLVKQGVLHQLPAVIVEHAFLDNREDYDRFLRDPDGLAALAAADARGIARYFGLTEEKSGKSMKPVSDRREKLLWVKDELPEHNEVSYQTYYQKGKASSADTEQEVPVQDELGIRPFVEKLIRNLLRVPLGSRA
jgi:N-acetylmuramoyl-L-alanine amidase